MSSDCGIKEKNRLPYFKGGSTSDFIEFYDRLTATLHAKGKRWRQALYSLGPFRGYCFRDLVADEEDDDVDDLRHAPPAGGSQAAVGGSPVEDDDSMPLLEVTRDSPKKEAGGKDGKHALKPELAKPPSRVPVDESSPDQEDGDGGGHLSSICEAAHDQVNERDIQALYLGICRKIYSLILQCLAPEPHRQLRNYGCQAGDGPVAHRLLQKIYQGTGSVALIKLIKSLVSLKMEGKFLQLQAYGSEFRRCAVSISSLGYNLDQNVLKALYLIGLSSSYESVISTIANAGFENISLEKLKESVRSQRDLLGIRERPKFPALMGTEQKHPEDTKGSRKFKCYNCRQVHEGGERKCKAPCRLCNSKKHTRYSCPKRKQKAGGGEPAQMAIPSAHLIVSRHKNSLLNSLPSNVNEDGPSPVASMKALPFIDSGAGGIYAAVRRVESSGGGHDLVFPSGLVGGSVRNAVPVRGSLTTANSAKLPYSVSCELWGLKDVKLVEGLHSHLIGTHPLIHNCGTRKNYVVLGPMHAHLVPVDDLVLPPSARRIGTADGTMFRFDVNSDLAMLTDSRPSNIFELLHLRTHWPLKTIVSGVANGSLVSPTIAGLSDRQLKRLVEECKPCHSCNLGKAQRRPVHRAYVMPRAIRPLQRIIVDFSSIQPRGAGGEFVYMAGIDEFSNRGYLVPTSARSNAPACLRAMLAPRLALRQKFARPVLIEVVRGDDAKEFKSDAFKKACADCNAVSCITAAPHHKNSIARVDVFMKFVQRIGGTLMATHSAPPSEWPFAAIMACDQLWNWKPNSGNRGVSPIEMDEGFVPCIEALRTFYAPVYVVRVGSRSSKFANTALFGRFLGFSRDSLGYVCRVLPSHRIVVRKDVHFIEDLEAGAHLSTVHAQLSDPGGGGEGEPVERKRVTCAHQKHDGPDNEPSEDAKGKQRRSSRDRTPVVRFSDGHLSQAQLYENIRNVLLSHDSGTIVCDQMAESAFKISHKIDLRGWSLPRNYKHSLKVPDAKEWAVARDKEFKNFEDHDVWEECIRPDRDVRILPIAEVYDIKFDANGMPIKRKYRICGKGFRQIKGIDYHNCYAPVIHADVLRMCMCVAVELGLGCVQFDFSAAFLHATNDVEMYVECPPGYLRKRKGDIVLKLKKVIYGMKQSAHRFYKLISGDFVKLGFKQSKSSPCLFVKFYGEENRVALLVLHVDDGGYFAKDNEVIEKDLMLLRRKYKLDHEPMNWYVGLRIVKKDASMGIICDAYIERCAKRFGIDKMAPQTHPAVDAPEKFEGESTCRKRFMELVGCLLYISTACRPDITTITNMLASQMACPSQKHLTMAEGVLSYLLATKRKGLEFRKRGVRGATHISKLRNMKLNGFFDSNFAEDRSRKSRTGMAIYYNGNLISWLSQLQTLVAQSVFEAETIAGNEALKTIKFLRKIAADICNGKEPMQIALQLVKSLNW